MEKYIKSIFLIVISSIISLIIFIFLINLSIFKIIPTLFYRGIFISFIISLITFMLLFLWKNNQKNLNSDRIIAITFCSLASNICFLVIVPVTVDRSISIFLLSRIAAYESSGLTEPQLRDLFIKTYVIDMRQIDRRLEEQKLSGSITVDTQGAIHMTERGRSIVNSAKWISQHTGGDPRFVGETETSPPTKH